MKENLEEVKNHYKLSQKEHDRISKEIIEDMLEDLKPVEKPKIIINIAPPGSGKTGLNVYGAAQFEDDNVLIINGDEYRIYHPQNDEIEKNHPEFYCEVTAQESAVWTSELFDAAIKGKYNIVFEGTGRKARILDTIKEKMQDYEIIVRGMAVDEFNCLVSILDRYKKQVEKKGSGRLVVSDRFYEPYNQMPNVIDMIEKSDVVDKVEVYMRGEDPGEPSIIYSSEENGKYPNAKCAVLEGRKKDRLNAIKNPQKQISIIDDFLEDGNITKVEKTILSRIMEIYNNSKDRDFEKKENIEKNEL